MKYADGGIVSGGMFLDGDTGVELVGKLGTPNRGNSGELLQGIKAAFAPAPDSQGSGFLGGSDFGSGCDMTAYSDCEGKEVVRPFSVGRINLDVLKVQPMMSDNISVHEIPILTPTNVGVNDNFCPHWLVLDDLVTTKENDAQTPTTPL